MADDEDDPTRDWYPYARQAGIILKWAVIAMLLAAFLVPFVRT